MTQPEQIYPAPANSKLNGAHYIKSKLARLQQSSSINKFILAIQLSCWNVHLCYIAKRNYTLL